MSRYPLLCPICRQMVYLTGAVVRLHPDKAGRLCPYSGEAAGMAR